MEEDKQNEYFQDYNYFQNESEHSIGRNFFFTENSYHVDFKEPLSLCYSQNNSIMNGDSPEKVQPTGVPTRTKDPKHPGVSSVKVSEPRDQILFDEASIDNYKTAYQGTKDDTVELNINFKTILVNYFKQLVFAKELDQDQIQRVTQFMGRVPSFNSLKLLFKDSAENKKIRKMCLELFSSSDCIKRIMSSRSKMKTKLQMTKYIQKIRLNILDSNRTIKWKDIVKRQRMSPE